MNANITEHILLVEDDTSLAQWVSDYLIEHGFNVSVASQGDTAISNIHQQRPDLVILDVMLPVKNGFEVCKAVREFYSSPILMMTACNEEADEVLGLELGADDYIAKPVKPRVLLARIKSLLRRDASFSQSTTLTFGQLHIDHSSKSVTLNDQSLAVTANEFDVLWLLASKAGTVVSRTELISQLRGIDYDGFDRSIDIRVSRLRKKLHDTTNPPSKIKTVRAKGYLFATDTWV